MTAPRCTPWCPGYVVTNDLMLFNRAGAGTATLPDPAVAGSGRQFTVRVIGAGTITVSSAAGSVDGGASVDLATGAGRVFVSDGTGWWSV